MWSFLFEGIFIYNMLLEGSVMQVKKDREMNASN